MNAKLATAALSICFALIAGAANAAMATTSRTFVLNQVSSTSIAPLGSNLGTVTLTQNGLYEVDVAVQLAQNTAFVLTGNSRSHSSFTFSLGNLVGQAVVTILGNEFTNAPGHSFTNVPYGTFTNAIDCTGCVHGASHSFSGPLDFKVTDINGITIKNFIGTTKGYAFSADVIGPSCGTGNIAALPEPGTYAMLLAGLGMIAFTAYRRKRGS